MQNLKKWCKWTYLQNRNRLTENTPRGGGVDWHVLCSVAQSCLSLCDHMDCCPPGSSVHGILQARTLEWAAIPSSRGSSWPWDRTRSPSLQVISLQSEPPGKPKNTGVGSLSLLQGISGLRNWTGVSCIAGGFFTSWATREAQDWHVHPAIFKIDNQQGPTLYSTGNPAHCSVTTYTGKEFEKE